MKRVVTDEPSGRSLRLPYTRRPKPLIPNRAGGAAIGVGASRIACTASSIVDGAFWAAACATFTASSRRAGRRRISGIVSNPWPTRSIDICGASCQ